MSLLVVLALLVQVRARPPVRGRVVMARKWPLWVVPETYIRLRTFRSDPETQALFRTAGSDVDVLNLM